MTDFKKISVLVGLVLSLSGGGEVGAKTASWSVEPKYSNIEMLSPGTYLVKRGVYSSIIDGEGRAIVPNTTDSITPFVENQALILTPAEDGRYRLQGILHDDFTTTAVAEEAYVDDYPFFSEGLLPVCNKSGFTGIWIRQDVLCFRCAISTHGRSARDMLLLSRNPREDCFRA